MQSVKRALSAILLLLIIFHLPIRAFAVGNTPVYSSNLQEGKRIALTFDDGPHPRNTPKILDILDKYGIKATFFLIGVNAKNYPEALKMVIDKGHEIGNHTYSHKPLKSKSKDEIYKEIMDTEREIAKSGSFSTSLIRPPCGLYDNTLVEIAIENDYKIVLWNIDTKDWAHTSSSDIFAKVVNNVRGGDIVLFHDYISGENNTVEALNLIIPKLISLGYEFVTVSELLQNV